MISESQIELLAEIQVKCGEYLEQGHPIQYILLAMLEKERGKVEYLENRLRTYEDNRIRAG